MSQAARNPQPKLRRVCAWCSHGRAYEAVIEDGDAEAPVTHGICPPCRETFLHDADCLVICATGGLPASAATLHAEALR